MVVAKQKVEVKVTALNLVMGRSTPSARMIDILRLNTSESLVILVTRSLIMAMNLSQLRLFLLMMWKIA